MTIPYVYLLGWTSQNKWYYGRRTANGCNPSEFWINYFSSSKYVKLFIEEHGEPDVIQIRKTFSDVDKCKQWETKILKHFKVESNENWLNRKEGDSKWDTTNKTLAIDLKTGNKIGMVFKNDIRFELGTIEKYWTAERFKQTVMKKHNVENVSQLDSTKLNRKITFQNKYGANAFTQTESFKKKSKETLLEKYGVDNFNKQQIICPHCDIQTSPPHIPQCDKNPNKIYTGHPGNKNPNAKKFIITTPSNEQIVIHGNLLKKCKELGFDSRTLRKGKIPGWSIVEI